MLKSIEINQIALIEHEALSFGPGFTVLTGETGAGKSILIESFNFVLGERASREIIRTGSKKASVEAVFSVNENDTCYCVLKDNELWPEDGELVLYRELAESGKNVCRVNGILVGTALLKTIGDALIDIHGQHQHQSLLDNRTHLPLIDAFADDEVLTVKEKVCNAYRNYKQANNALKEASVNERERIQKCDLYAYQLKEIRGADLAEGEEEKLLAERERLRHAETIMESLTGGYELINGDNGIIVSLSELNRRLQSISSLGDNYKKLSEEISELYYSLEDIGYSIRDERDSFLYDPSDLDRIEERLELIASLKRKYGSNVTDVLSYADTIEKEYARLSGIEEERYLLEEKEKQALSNYRIESERLSKLRRGAAAELEKAIVPELVDLGMGAASFTVSFERLEGEVPSADGYDSIEFLFSANRGEPVRPLAKVASGGELSRIMLALKKVLNKTGGVPTMVFDEIDTGVSGKIGTAIAQKMRQIAYDHQVFCITHLAQIAAAADTHYLIAKRETEEHTISETKCLSETERVSEIARIMDGNQNDPVAIAHAQRLLETVNNCSRN